MPLLEYLSLLIAVLCCTAAPADKGCRTPDRVDEALQGEWNDDEYPSGTIATYFCHPGYSRLGSIKRECKKEKWQYMSPKGSCRKKSCGHPGDIPFGTFELKNENAFVFGAVVEYFCDEGYHMVSKRKTRECTATGWSNNPPHCEVRNCPQVVANDNVNVLSTSYDEEFSVGQVVRFECKNPSLKLEGNSEIFCTSEGEWNSVPPRCIETTCSQPSINNGAVRNSKQTPYKENELIQFGCNRGFKASRNGEATCTKVGWSPPPSCEEITCSPHQYVDNGKVVIDKDVYREGDTITLICDNNYQIQYEPDKLRECTTNGWSPSLTCISKKCDRPELINGKLDVYSNSYFPKQVGTTLYYKCNTNFLPLTKEYWERTLCTKYGWEPAPKCYRTCSYNDATLDNANINPVLHVYLEGETIQFTCHTSYRTPDGTDRGKRTCLPNGEFTPAKCSKTCKTPPLPHGRYQPNKSTFEIGDYLHYECDDGYKTSNKNRVEISQCTSNGWSVTVACTEIRCQWNNYEYSYGVKYIYNCPSGQRPADNNLTQCFYYGLGPPPKCQDENLAPPTVSSEKSDEISTQSTSTDPSKDPVKIPGGKPAQPDSTDSSNYPVETPKTRLECAPAHSPKNAEIINPRSKYYSDDTVEMTCKRGFKIHGTAIIQCKNGIWETPPQCIQLKLCMAPINIKDGKITKESLQKVYTTGNIVRYSCNPGFQISRSDQSTCMNEQWSALPICEGKPCDNPSPVKNAVIKGKIKDFKHGESANYQCETGFIFSGGSSAKCIKGVWMETPICVRTSCGPPPNVNHATLRRHQKDSYASGEMVTYMCDLGYSLEQSMKAQAVCENTEWKDIPVCRKTGERCGLPPVVQFGDIIGNINLSHESGSYLQYKCPDYYTIEGKQRIKCEHGVWEKAPVCIEPCTAKEKDMKENNIQPKWKSDEKLYSKHGDHIHFACINGYEVLADTEMRIICDRGVLQYPKCFKTGSCALLQSTMISNNINFNRSTVIENGETILFECNEGMLPENNLQAKCDRKRINYPKCVAAKTGERCGLPPVVQFGDIIGNINLSHESGSYLQYKCPDYYTIEGKQRIKCEHGVWEKAPVCIEPCTAKEKDMKENNIQPKWKSDEKLYSKHGDHIDFACINGYEVLADTEMRIICDRGVLQYPKCFKTGSCALLQSTMISNNINFNRSTVIENGETILFECNEGMLPENNLQAKCDRKRINYPKCVAAKTGERCGLPPVVQFGDIIGNINLSHESGSYLQYKCPDYYTIEGKQRIKCEHGVWEKAPVCIEPCTAKEKDMKENNIQPKWKSDEKLYSKHGDHIHFACINGYEVLADTEMRIICDRGVLQYPKCFKTGSCALLQSTMISNNINFNRSTVIENGETILFECNEGMLPENNLQAKCDRKRINYPKCVAAKTGERCGLPPVVQFGDIIGNINLSHESGSYLQYKCPDYYIIEGKQRIKCEHGVWEKAPVCIEPCTAKEKDMKENNIQPKWKSDEKLYSKHGDHIHFACINGYEVLADTEMRIICDRGVLQYPKCFKTGSCALLQSTMISNNINFNRSTVIENGETILFECNEGMLPENNLQAKCDRKRINYPKCVAAKSCKTPEITNGNLKTEQQGSYGSGSFVEFECKENYVLSGNINVKCIDGQWIDLPQCLRPCKISMEDLNKNKIQLQSSDDLHRIYEDGTEVDITCKSGFKRPNQVSLKGVCEDGNMKYQRCFIGNPCRIDQDEVDGNNLELHEENNSEVFYEEGENIRFNCKEGFRSRTEPTGKCSKQKLSYPTCKLV